MFNLSLLGHNGAGKTTTISTLTGLVEATSGDVNIYGYSLRSDLSAIRQITGLCPQLNVLFSYLTVDEHLRFFGVIKGLTGYQLHEAVDKVIQEVGLTEKRYVLSTALSGGMKRKLSLAMALIGDPKFVLLDEPTSGMDPYSRRATWELLQRSKVGRVIILTTHFMDEADTLADRIAIMSEGCLLCSGSSLFLKNRFGFGYLLSISKSHIDAPVDVMEQSIKNIVEDVALHSLVAGEVIFQLPLGSSDRFGKLFRMLQERSDDLCIGSYGISITTLEQVFISLAHVNSKEAREDDLIQAKKRFVLLRWLEAFNNWLEERVYPSTFSSRAMKSLSEKSKAKQLKIEATLPLDSARIAVQDDEHVNEYNFVAKRTDVEAKIDSDEWKFDGNSHENDTVRYEPVSATSNSEKNIESELVDSNTGGIAKTRFFIQCLELYRKRLIVAIRDWKGFFFQIVFPAIQIILILLILTVNINPAGRSLVFNGDFYRRYAKLNAVDVQAGNNMVSNEYRMNMLGGFDQLLVYNSSNSTALSEYLLNPNYLVHSRYGAVVYDDSIPFELTVDWAWVQANGPTFFKNNTYADILAKDLILQIVGTNRTFDITNNQQILQFFGINVTSLSAFKPNDTLIRTNLDNANTLFNLSLPVNSIINFINNISNPVNISQIIDSGHTTVTITNAGLLFKGDFQPLFTVQKLQPWSSIDWTLLFSLLPKSGVTTTEYSIPSSYTVMHNTSSTHAVAAWHGELIESIFQTCANHTTNILLNAGAPSTMFPKGKIKYVAKDHPLPITAQQALAIRVILSLLTAIFILVPLCYIPAAFVAFLVKERVSKSKHLQIVSGVSPYLYWLATYVWDMTLFAILTLFIIIAMFMFGTNVAQVFIGSVESTLALFCLLLVYGASSIPLCYLYSFWFVNFSTAQIAIMVINFMTGFVTVLAYYIMISIPKTAATGAKLVHLFR